MRPVQEHEEHGNNRLIVVAEHGNNRLIVVVAEHGNNHLIIMVAEHGNNCFIVVAEHVTTVLSLLLNMVTTV